MSETSDEELQRADVPELARLVATGNYAFLIGAGTSRPRPSGIPTAGELIDEWRLRCYEFQHPNETDPSEDTVAEWAKEQENDDSVEPGDEYGYWFDRFHPDPAARREYIQELVDGADPTTGHLILASMMSHRSGGQQVPLTLTPNFDDLLFDAFYLLSEERPQIINHRAVVPEFQITQDDPAIVKLHGDYLYSNLRNTDEETDRLSESMETVVTETTKEYGLIVVGYSGRDDSIMSALEDADISGNRLYWCVRRPREHHDADTVGEKISDRAAKLVRESDGRVVPIEGFNSLMSQFRQLINDLPPVTEKDELQDRFDQRVAQLDEILEERDEADPSEAEEEELDISELSQDAFSELQNGKYENAILMYSRLIDRDGETVARLVNRGYAKEELGDYEDAIADYDRALEIDPENSDVYYNRGNAKQELGDYEDAIGDYDRALEIDPKDSEAYNNRGNAKQELGDYEDAITDYDRALEIDPEKSETYNNRGNAKQRLGDYEDAIADYDRALEIDPENSEAYNNRGSTKQRLGDYEDAIADYDRALEINPEYSVALQNRSEARIRFGQFTEAKQDVEKARSLSDTTEENAINNFLYLITLILLEENTQPEEQEYRNLCEQDFTTSWRFEGLDTWLADADLDPDKETRITELIDLLREHKED